MAGTTATEEKVVYDIPYEPRQVFWDYHARTERWACIVAHRRCGKTVACINDIISSAFLSDLEHGRYAYIAPFLSQAKEVAWEYLKRFAAPIIQDKNEGELWVELLNGSRIRLHGADNPDRLRGNYLDGAILDEFGDMRPSIFGEVIRPMLADRLGWVTFIGTPKGRNEFSAIYERSKTTEGWFSAMLRASETGILNEEELASARLDMTPEQYEQEFECSFDAAITGSYFGREIAAADREGRITDVAYEPSLPVHTSWDLGIGDSTAIWFWQVSGSEIRVIDHYENNGRGLGHYVKVIDAKGYRERGRDYVPHDARVRELGTGRTRVETLSGLGCEPALVPDHKLMDGVNAARLTIPRCWFDRDRCKDGLEALRQYRADFDEKLKVFRDKPRHDWTSHCLTGDTEVLTRNGIYQIKDLPNQGSVLTPCGWKQYRNPRITRRNAPLVAVAFSDGLMVRCTPDHIFLTDSGWRFARDLRKGSLIQSSLTLSRNILMAASTAYGRARNIFHAAARSFTARSGAVRSGMSPRDAISTTAIGTRDQITLRTWSAYLEASTYRSHGINLARQVLQSHSLNWLESGRRLGINQMRGGFGIADTLSEPRAGQNGSERIVRAIIAAGRSMLSSAKAAIARSFARIIARPRHIERVSLLNEIEDVWCITVPDGEWFSLANGAVVHNSADAFRYMAMAYQELEAIPEKPAPRWLPDVTLDELWDLQEKPVHAKRL